MQPSVEFRGPFTEDEAPERVEWNFQCGCSFVLTNDGGVRIDVGRSTALMARCGHGNEIHHLRYPGIEAPH